MSCLCNGFYDVWKVQFQRGPHSSSPNLKTVTGVSDKDRQTVFISLTVISLVGCFLLFLIRKPDPEPAPSEASQALLQAEQSDSLESSSRWALTGFLWASSHPEQTFISLGQSSSRQLTFNWNLHHIPFPQTAAIPLPWQLIPGQVEVSLS